MLGAALNLAELVRIEVHGPAEELAKLKPLEQLNPPGLRCTASTGAAHFDSSHGGSGQPKADEVRAIFAQTQSGSALTPSRHFAISNLWM
jgi:hypothetical protein